MTDSQPTTSPYTRRFALAIAVVIALFATSCGDFEANVVVGSADEVETAFDVDDFTSIDIEEARTSSDSLTFG